MPQPGADPGDFRHLHSPAAGHYHDAGAASHGVLLEAGREPVRILDGNVVKGRYPVASSPDSQQSAERARGAGCADAVVDVVDSAQILGQRGVGITADLVLDIRWQRATACIVCRRDHPDRGAVAWREKPPAFVDTHVQEYRTRCRRAPSIRSTGQYLDEYQYAVRIKA